MTPLETVAAELRAVRGVTNASIVNDSGFIGHAAVTFDYTVLTGRHKNRTFTIAVGFQEDAYPEYPPHFVYVADLRNPQIQIHSSFDHAGKNWLGFSVPPSDFWTIFLRPRRT